MTDPQWWLAVFLFAIISTATPGPNNIMLLASGLNFGARRSVPHGLGIVFGFPLMVLALGLGLGQMFMAFPVVHEVIKYVGIAYLVFLAWKIAHAHQADMNHTVAKPLTFLQAALFQWMNPKAWVMALGSISTFTHPGADIIIEVLLLALLFLLAAVISTNAWIFCGVLLTQVLADPRQRRYFNMAMGLLLLLSVLPMLFSHLPWV